MEGLPKKEKHQNGFSVTRVNNRWDALHRILRIVGKLKKKKFEIVLLALLVWNTLWNLNLINGWLGSAILFGSFALLAMGTLMITKTKLPTLLTRSYIFGQMIYHGRKRKYDFLSFK